MKKNNLLIKFRPARLFLEDLQEIENISKELSIFKSIEISILDHEFSSFSEVKDEYKECNEILIIIKKQNYSSINITFSKYNNSIADYDPDLETRGIIQKIYEVIVKREKNNSINFIKAIEQLKWIGLAGIISSFFFSFNKTRLIIACLSSLLYLFSGIPLLFPLRSEIIFISRKKRSSFWERNKDQLIVNGIVSILSLFVGFLLAKIK